MSIERKTVAQWVYSLEAPDAQLTLSEFMALCLLHIRENVKDAREGTQHLEGMVGTLDKFMATSSPHYASLAKRGGRSLEALGGANDAKV